MVHAEAQCPVLLHERGTEGEEGEHRVGQALLRGGTAWATLSLGRADPSDSRKGDPRTHSFTSMSMRQPALWLKTGGSGGVRGVTLCCVLSLQVLPDRDGKRCMFCVKTSSRTYEMSASDTRQRQEWTLGPCPPHTPSPASPCPLHVPTDRALPLQPSRRPSGCRLRERSPCTRT